MSRGVWVLLGGAIVAAVMVACNIEEAPTPPVATPHSGFPITGAHLRVDCEGCHVDTVQEQGLQQRADAVGWVTDLSTDCLDCHADTSAQVFPGGHKNGASCAAENGCHSVSDFCWSQVRNAACGDPGDTDPPAPLGHVDALGDLFPLEGPHTIDKVTITGCSTCHTGTSDAEQRGGSDFCSDCHSRPDPAHYPPERDGAEERERGCKSCHASHDANNKLVVPSDWTAGSVVHDFQVPHSIVEDWDINPPVLKDESQWVVGCENCHATPGQYATYDCSSCHPAAELSAITTIHDNTPSPCDQCHPSGT